LKVVAFKLGEQFGVLFTKILDYEPKVLETEDDNGITTRQDWEKWAAPTTMAIADQILLIARELNPKAQIDFKFNKAYINTNMNGKRSTVLNLVPQKKQMKLTVKLESRAETDKLCVEAGFDANYSSYWSGYQFDLRPGDVDSHQDFFRELIRISYAEQYDF
jgi:hypothetical protein